MEEYPDQEDMEYMMLDNERQHHHRMVFEDIKGGVDYQKVILHIHDKIWGVYMNNKWSLIKGWYCVEVSGYDGKKVRWEVVDDHVAEDPKQKDEKRLQGSYFFMKTRGGGWVGKLIIE